MGGRLEPKGGLQAYFEPLNPSLKDTNSLSDAFQITLSKRVIEGVFPRLGDLTSRIKKL